MTFDISDTLAPKSDQLDAVELAGGPRTFTIERVTKGNAEQPVNVHLAGFPRPWRPGKSMRRVLAAAWGTDAGTYAGRSVTLYCEPDVEFGGAQVGGTRISHLSHIDGPLRIPLLIKRGKSAVYTVQPLIEEARPDYATQVAAATTKDALNGIWRDASTAGHLDDALKAAILARGGELVDDAQEVDQ